jgi:hypothetical protein
MIHKPRHLSIRVLSVILLMIFSHSELGLFFSKRTFSISTYVMCSLSWDEDFPSTKCAWQNISRIILGIDFFVLSILTLSLKHYRNSLV